MTNSCNHLLATIRDLRNAVTDEAAGRMNGWEKDIEQASFTASATNLAYYLAVRHHDLRELQRELMRHGLSSLGRLESRVLLTLQTVEATLSRLQSTQARSEGW